MYSAQSREVINSLRRHVAGQHFIIASLCAVVLAGCQSVPVSSPEELNKTVAYLPWGADNGLHLLPGMELRTFSTSQTPRGKNTRVPTSSQQEWVLPAPGEVSRADWARFHHLLVASRFEGGSVNIHQRLNAIADGMSGSATFSNTFGDRVVGQAVSSMQIVYTKYGSMGREVATASYLHRKICEGSYSDFTAFDPDAQARTRSRMAKSATGGDPSSVFLTYDLDGLGTFWAHTGDDWYFQKDIGLIGRGPPNEWFNPRADPVDARQAPDAAIRVQISPTGAREWASPCLSLQEVERRTGAKVIAIRRSDSFLQPKDGKLKPKLRGRDGRFTIAFRDFYQLEGARAYYKAQPSLKAELVLAHGDMVVLDRSPTRIGYRLD